MNFFFIAEQIIKNQYPLWKVFFKKLLERDDTFILVKDACPINERETIKAKICEIYNVSKSSLNFDIIENTTKTGHLLVLETLSHSENEILKNFKKVGTIGYNKDLNQLISYYKKINCELILSEMLVSEVPKPITNANFSYLTNYGYFIPPSNEALNIKRVSENKIILIVDTSEKLSSLENRIMKTLNTFNEFQIIDLKNINNEEVFCANKIISFVRNQQINHALNTFSNIEFQFSNPLNENPFRNIFYGNFNASRKVRIKNKDCSIRSYVKPLLEISRFNQITTKNSEELKKATSVSDEIFSLLCYMRKSSGEILPNRKFSLPYIPKVLTKEYEGFPNWINHFATESHIHQFLAENCIDSEKARYLRPLCEDALLYLHCVDSESNFFSTFKKLYPQPSEEILNKFHKVIHEVHSKNNSIFTTIDEAKQNLVSKFLRAELTHLCIRNNPQLKSDDYLILDRFLVTEDDSKKNKNSPNMHKLQILVMSGELDEALNYCKVCESNSSKNILLTTFAVLAVLVEKFEYAKQALSYYEEVEKQYAKDNVSVAYLVSRLFLKNLNDDQSIDIIKFYKNNSPAKAWWMNDLICMAFVKLSPIGEDTEMLSSCIQFLKDKCNFYDKEIECLRNFKISFGDNTKTLHKQFLEIL